MIVLGCGTEHYHSKWTVYHNMVVVCMVLTSGSFDSWHVYEVRLICIFIDKMVEHGDLQQIQHVTC